MYEIINIRDQVGLELVEIDVEVTVESKRSSDGGNDLGNQSVEVGERGRGDAQVSSANVVDAINQ